ncbi:hypothetical protein [Dubosiella newyorkensis]|uniref:hypothetical protein n=1 Tax=Dubosiella newyorkensis TaxID=1862672 RepID=UPI0023F57B3D|nr:hypothetical protein [Dubosiella newyorkensis]
MNQISESMREFLKDEELEIFDNRQHQFSQLANDEEIIVVINLYGEENLYIQTGAESAVLAFGQWRDEYDNSSEDIARLKADISHILNNESYVWTIINAPSFLVGYVYDHKVQYLPCTNLFDWDYSESKEFFTQIAEEEGQQSFLFWDPHHPQLEPSLFLM